MGTETIDKLFLELSQVTKAQTKKEIVLSKALNEAKYILYDIASKGHIYILQDIITSCQDSLDRIEKILKESNE